MDVFDYRDKHRIITYRTHASCEGGIPIEMNGEVVGYYIEDGFSVISIPMKKLDNPTSSFIWYITCCLVVMNEDKDVSILSGFMFHYLNHFNKKENYLPNLEYCGQLVSRAFEVADEEMVLSTRKFNFTKNISSKERRSLIMGFLNKRKTTDTLAKIENAIQWLIIEGNGFITVNEIVSACDGEYSKSTVKRYMNLLKDDIDTHNRKVFGTDNFVLYKKTLSIHKIKGAIQILNEANERLSRRKVAKEAGIHFNTVQNLWDDDEIQEELDKFNQIDK